MSIKVMSRVWDDADASGGELLVLLALADFSNEKYGCAWPSIDTLAKKSRLSDRQTQRAIRSLESKGLLRIEENAGPKGVHLYYVTCPTEGVTKCHPDTMSGVTSTAPGGEAHVTQTVKEPLVPLSPLPEKLRTERMTEAWARWMSFRRNYKKPKSWNELFNGQIEFLSRYTEDEAFGILDYSLRNGYQGLFEPRNKNRTSTPRESATEMVSRILKGNK